MREMESDCFGRGMWQKNVGSKVVKFSSVKFMVLRLTIALVQMFKVRRCKRMGKTLHLEIISNLKYCKDRQFFPPNFQVLGHINFHLETKKNIPYFHKSLFISMFQCFSID